MLLIESIDLHGNTLEEANKIMEQFISESYLENVKKLIVFRRKGLHSQNDKDPYPSKDLSILKYSLPDFIEGNQELMKKRCNLSMLILKIVIVVLFIYII